MQSWVFMTTGVQSNKVVQKIKSDILRHLKEEHFHLKESSYHYNPNYLSIISMLWHIVTSCPLIINAMSEGSKNSCTILNHLLLVSITLSNIETTWINQHYHQFNRFDSHHNQAYFFSTWLIYQMVGEWYIIACSL